MSGPQIIKKRQDFIVTYLREYQVAPLFFPFLIVLQLITINELVFLILLAGARKFDFNEIPTLKKHVFTAMYFHQYKITVKILERHIITN